MTARARRPTLLIAVAAHQATYANPIRVRKGEALVLTGETEEWDGWRWLWAASGGREGWVPDDLPERSGRFWRAARDYSAAELTVRPGQRLAALKSGHGWVWCLDDDGEEGWVPERVLEPAD